jgi:choline dehydrogenase-like flavoprotein
MSDAAYELVLVGSGFASAFFLKQFLGGRGEKTRVLVLERGALDPHRWKLEKRSPSSVDSSTTFVNRSPKPWRFTVGFGGSSSCWWGVTPRFLPSDFRLRSLYGVGRDWPLTYDELEPFYCQAERMMNISGPSDGSPAPRSEAYPQPPHLMTLPDRLLKAAYPDRYFVQPTARARVATSNRPACCASGVCGLCPIDAKFTIENEMMPLFRDPRVTLRLGAIAEEVETRNGVAIGVRYRTADSSRRAAADLVGLGANAIFNPWLLKRSGLDHPSLGTGIHEQVGVRVVADLDNVEGFQGSTSLTAHGYMLYDGPERAHRAGCLIESSNIPALRAERGRWSQRAIFKFIFEDLPSDENRVDVDESSGLPSVTYRGASEYTRRSIDLCPKLAGEVLSPLPIERLEVDTQPQMSQAHILGTTVMGDDPAKSITDRHLIHHRVRNLLVLGSGAFPVSGPSNPTLTVAALSLWAAEHLKASTSS